MTAEVEGNSTQADFYQDFGSGSSFFHATVEETAVSVAAFVALMALIISLVSVTFGWVWLPRAFLALVAVSGTLLVRSRLMGRKPAYYEECVHLTTVTVGLLAGIVVLVNTFG